MSPVEAVAQSLLLSKEKQAFIYRVDVPSLNAEHAEWIDLLHVGRLMAYPVYWFYTTAPASDILDRVAQELLIDPILQTYVISREEGPLAPLANWETLPYQWLMEKQFLPGVTDNLGKTVEKSLPLMFPNQELPNIQVASGRVYCVPKTLLTQSELLETVAYKLYNPLVERMLVLPFTEGLSHPERYRFPQVQSEAMQSQAIDVVPLDLPDDDLLKLSQQRNLALTLDEMKVIRQHFEVPAVRQRRQAQGLPAWPTDIELEILAQTWSEHCKHKIFAAQIEYTDASDPDFPETITIDSLFKTYIAGSTQKLMAKRPDLLSVFKDNAGVLRWNEDWGVCFKVETHNSPSALEPYGGALTGIVGVNRDILGTGLGAKPLFNTDVFCFAHPEEAHANRPTMLPADAILKGVRKGVEDGGNKSGIPTVNGSLFFDSRYRAKPLVFCGTGGLLPLKVGDKLGYEKYTEPGDTIVMAGGRVGKDGIHGATFSSEALHQDSPVSAVQIGDPITQKRMLDFLMEARDQGLLTGMTDNGAGGLSSSVGEMAEQTHGAALHLEKIPLKYPGLAPYEIVISESQERMTLSTRDFEALEHLARKHDVEISAIGEFHANGTFDIIQNGTLLASLDLDFLHHGLPQMQLKAEWRLPKSKSMRAEAPKNPTEILLKLLQSPNICSREALIRQYDHEVQGRSVVKPLMGPLQTAPCDAAVLQPLLGQPEGLVVSNGLCPQFSDWDAYHMATCTVDEAVRNAVAVGADPKSIAILDNFCWPDPLASSRNPDATYKLAQLVRANQALYDITLAYETPLISGKDSMKNDFDDGEFRLSIPPTLLVSAIGKMPNIEKAVSMEFKAPGDVVFLLGQTNVHMGGSQYYVQMGWYSPYSPCVSVSLAKELYLQLYECIQKGWIRSCHDLSEGGLAVALAESSLGSAYGVHASLDSVMDHSPELRWDEALFSESPSRFVLSVAPEHLDSVTHAFEQLPLLLLGEVVAEPHLTISAHNTREECSETLIDVDTGALRTAWRRSPAEAYETGMQP